MADKNTILDLSQAIVGIEKFTNSLRKIDGTEKSIDNLVNIVATLNAASEQFSRLSKVGDYPEVMKYLATVEKIVDKLKTLQKPGKAGELKLPEFTAVRPTKEATRERLVSSKQKEIAATYPAGQVARFQKLIDEKAEKSVSSKDVDKAYKKETKEYEKEAANFVKEHKQARANFNNEIKKVEQEILQLQKDLRSMHMNLSKVLKSAEKKAENTEREAEQHRAKRDEYDPKTKKLLKINEERERIEAERAYKEQYQEDRQRFARERAETGIDYKSQIVPGMPKVGSLQDADTVGKVQTELNARKELVAIRTQEFNVAQQKLKLAQDDRELAAAEKELSLAAQNLNAAQKLKDEAKQKLEVLKEEQALLKKSKTEALQKASLISDKPTLTADTAKQIAQQKMLDDLNKSDLKTVQDKLLAEREVQAELNKQIQITQDGINKSEFEIKNAKSEKEVVESLTRLEQQRNQIRDLRNRNIQSGADIKELENIEKVKLTMQNMEKIAENIGQKMKAGLATNDAKAEVQRLNSELAKIPAHLRPEHAQKLNEQLKLSGLHTKVVGDKLEYVKQSFINARSAVSGMVTQTSSLEKIMNRISFVITAKLSYLSFDRIVRTLKNLVVNFAQFEDEMSKTFALVSRAGASAHQDLMDLVKRTSLEYRTELKSVSEALYQIVSAQFNAKDAALVLDAAMKLAVGGFSEAKDAALALVQILNAFDMDARSAEHVADIMFETSRLGIVTTQQYANEISKLASTASMFGLSIEDVSAAIATMTRNGVKVEQAFTSLNQMLMTIANPTEKARKVMDAYGVTLDMNVVRAQGLMGALKGMGEILESEEAMLEIFKTRTGAKAMFSLVQHDQEYVSDLVSMYSSVGAAQDAVNTRMKTTASLLKKLQTESKALSTDIGKRLQDSFKGTLNDLIGVLEFFRKHINLTTAAVKGLVLAIGSMLVVQLLRLTAQVVRSTWIFVSSLFSIREAAKITWAEITMGLSLVIGLVTTLIQYFVEAAKTAREMELSKSLGLIEAEQRLGDVNKQIADLDANISKIKGIDKLLSQFEELSKAQEKNAQAKETHKKMSEELAKQLSNILGIQVTMGDVETKLSELRDKLFEKRLAQEREIARLLLQQQAIQTGKNVRNIITDRDKEIDKKPLHGQSELDKAFKSFATNVLELSKNTKSTNDEILNLSKNVGADKLSKQIDYVSKQSELGIARVEKELKEAREKLQAVTVEVASGMTVTSGYSETAIQSIREGKQKIDAAQREVSKKEKELRSRRRQQEALSDNFANIRQTILDYEIAASQYELSMQDIGVEQYSAAVSKAMKDLKGAASGAGKQIRDYVFEIVDKYIDLFRSVGFAVEDSFGDKLTGINAQVEKLKKDVHNILPDQKVTDSLNTLGGMLQSFALFDGVIKKRNRKISDVVANYDKAKEILGVIGQGDSEYRKMAENLITLGQQKGIPRIQALGEALIEMYTNGLQDLSETFNDYMESEFNKLLSKAHSEAEKAEISESIARLNEEFFNEVSKKSIKELEELINEETTKSSYKPYLRKQIDERRKQLGKVLQMLAGKTGEFISDIEKGMMSVSELLDKARGVMSAMGLGLSESDLLSVFSAIMSGNEKEIEKISKDVFEKVVVPPREIDGKENVFREKEFPDVSEFMKLNNEDRELYLKNFEERFRFLRPKELDEFLEGVTGELYKLDQKKDKNLQQAQKEFDDFNGTMSLVIDDSAAIIHNLNMIFEATKGNFKTRLKNIKLSADNIETFRDFDTMFKEFSLAFGEPFKKSVQNYIDTNFKEDAQFKDVSDDIKVASIVHGLKVTAPMGYNPTKLINRSALGEIKRPEIQAIAPAAEYGEDKIEELRQNLETANQELENIYKAEYLIGEFRDKVEQEMNAKRMLNLLIELFENDKELVDKMKALQKSGDVDKINKFIQEFVFKTQKPGDVTVGELFKPGRTEPEKTSTKLRLFGKEKLKWGEPITLDEAYNMTVQKGIELAEQAMSAHYDREIEMLEERNRKAIELEQQKQEAMLANENMSSAEKEVIQKKFAERQRKMQEENDKKVARLRKKQAVTELTINFAKGIAEIWIRELSSKGAIGFASAAALTALVSTVYAAQLSMINKQKFASGGYTGIGYGQPDSTGQRPAGIVHEGELVIDKKTLNRNFDPLMSMYAHMRGGKSFEDFIVKYLLGNAKAGSVGGMKGGLYASGGYVAGGLDSVNVKVDMGNVRVLDEVDLAILVERGGKKRRYING